MNEKFVENYEKLIRKCMFYVGKLRISENH